MTDSFPPLPGRGLPVASLVLAIIGAIAAVVVLFLFGAWAVLSLMTGAPLHVLTSIGKMGAISAAFTVVPLSALALAFGVVSLRRLRGWTPRPRGHRLAVSGVVIAALALVAVLLSTPLWGVEACFSIAC